MNRPVNRPAPAPRPGPAPQPAPAAQPAPAPRPRGQAPQLRAQEPGASMAPECDDEVCITCSDTAVAVTIARLLPDGLAVVDTEAGQEEVSVALVDAGVGDTVLVHAGEAIAVVPA
jgi:hydrogenase expression/formation protein HypC